MTDYDELVKALQCVDLEPPCEECKYFNGGSCDEYSLEKDAADAIEELTRIVREYQKFDGFLAAHGMFEQEPMIAIEPPKEETE